MSTGSGLTGLSSSPETIGASGTSVEATAVVPGCNGSAISGTTDSCGTSIEATTSASAYSGSTVSGRTASRIARCARKAGSTSTSSGLTGLSS